ncbi:MAG: S9 family peptidase [Acidobacteriota bacterium]|nr:S9 family peptidase [Acidobacteriota bacterium]
MLRRLGFACALIALLALTSLATQAAAAPIHLKDFRALVRIDSPRFSPDGRQIAFLTIRPDFVHDRYDVTLNVMDAAGGKSRVLVHAMLDVHMPHWSPDGRTIAFIAEVGKGKPQIYTVPAAGGTPEELSDAPNGVEQFAWSPDGETVAYVTPDDSPLRAKDRRTHHDLFTIHHDDYLINEPPVPSHVWLLSLKSGKARQLTHGATSLLETAPPFGGGVSAPAWSADGKWIVYTQQANANDSDSDRTAIAVVNVATGEEHLITGKRSYEYAPRFAPQDDSIAYLYPHGPGPISVMDLFVASPAGGSARDISTDLDRDLGAEFAWLPNGHSLVAIANDHLGAKLYVQPLGGKGHALDLGDLNPLHVAVSSRGALAVVADSATQAPELYLLSTMNSRPTRLTDFNSAFAVFTYARSVEVEWRAPDGQPNDGILTYPNSYKPGTRYPLVVFSHGGPEAASTEDFDTGEIGPLRHLFAADGYLVFEPNYRGSDNLGTAHEHAIYRDPGAGPDSDVIAGVEMLEKKGIVDTSRIAAVGHSYGGYMTAWLIGHHHFWRCAVVADGVTDWTEEYELTGAGNLAWTRDSLGGTPWDKQSAGLYRTGSPITYAGQIATPTLILSGTADITVPITESFALYHALSSRHVPVKFIGIPGAHHSPQDPVHRELYYQAINEWVTQYLGHRATHTGGFRFLRGRTLILVCIFLDRHIRCGVYQGHAICVRNHRGAESPSDTQPPRLVTTVGRRDRAPASHVAAGRVEAPASAARRRFRGIHGGRTAPSLPPET